MVVDYRGYRVIAQSIIPGNQDFVSLVVCAIFANLVLPNIHFIPYRLITYAIISQQKCQMILYLSSLGILQRDQENSVIYGSIDAGKTITSNPEFRKLVSVYIIFKCVQA